MADATARPGRDLPTKEGQFTCAVPTAATRKETELCA
jgi:hypothetical protein